MTLISVMSLAVSLLDSDAFVELPMDDLWIKPWTDILPFHSYFFRTNNVLIYFYN